MERPDGNAPAICLTAADVDRLAEVVETGEFFWLDLEAADDGQIESTGQALGFHPLAIEDSQHFGQRPKVERHKDHMFIVFFGAAPAEDEDRLVEVHIYFTDRFLVTVRRDQSPGLDALSGRVKSRGLSGQMLLHALLDVLADSFGEVLEEIADETDEIEANILGGQRLLGEQEIYLVRRRLVGIGRTLHRQNAIYGTLASQLEHMEGFDPEFTPYFGDVGDHLARMSEQVDVLRERTSGAAELFLAAASNRMNVVMKQFTVIAGVFLPMSVVVGFFGMNFRWMVINIDTAAAFILLGLIFPLLTIFGLLAWFIQRGWLRQDE